MTNTLKILVNEIIFGLNVVMHVEDVAYRAACCNNSSMFKAQSSLPDFAGTATCERAPILEDRQSGQFEPLPPVDAHPIVAVLPYDPHRRVCIMISGQVAADDESGLEVISGSLVEGGPASQARTDAWDLAGVELDVLEPVAKVLTHSRVPDQRLHLFLGRISLSDGEYLPRGGKSPGAVGCAREMGFDRLETLVCYGELTDAKTLLLVQALMLRHPELWRRTLPPASLPGMIEVPLPGFSRT